MPQQGRQTGISRSPRRSPRSKPHEIVESLTRGQQPRERVWNATVTAVAFGMLIIVAIIVPADSWSIAVADRSPAWLVAAMEMLTDVALVRWYILLATLAMLYLGLVYWNAGTRIRKFYAAFIFSHALFVTVTMASVWLLIRVLKIAAGRERPEFLQGYETYDFEIIEFQDRYWSFPSGHAATAGVLTAILMLWFPRVRVPALLLGTLLSASRILVEEHYPTDVAAGFLIGFLVTVLLARWLAIRSLIFDLPSGKLMPYARWPRKWPW